MSHPAACRCGQLSLVASGDPVRVSVCHCLDCQKRSGSAFAAQARFPADSVTIAGTSNHYAHTGHYGVARFHFCPDCGSHLFFRHDDAPETIAVPIGMFADPHAFTPTVQVYGNRMHPWVEITGAPEQFD